MARSVNELLETFDFNIQGMTDSLQRLRDEDTLIMDELKRAEDAIQAKQHTLKYLDERIQSLTQQLEALRSEADERKAHIEQLKSQVEAARAEIEAAGADDPEAEELERQLAAKQAEVKKLEDQVKAKEAEYDEWREKVGIKQKVISRRSKSRKREYKPDQNDEADLIVGDYINRHQDPVPIQKVGFRSYIYGSKNIKVEEDAKIGPCVIINDGEAMRLDDFLEVFSADEKRKLESMREDEELVIGDKGDYQYRKSLRSSQYNFRE